MAGAAVLAVLLSARAAAQAPGAALPFAPGEACTYRGNGPLGRMGSGTFAVERDDAGGAGNWLLRFDFRGRVGPVVIENHTRSWFDPAETASVRFTKTERSPLSNRREDVRMDRAARRWTGGERSVGGAMPTAAPLDELSFIFFLRTLRLGDGDSHGFTRHYDTSRNPIRVRVLGRGPVRVAAGQFAAVQLEMRVRDPRQYGGEGVITIHFTDDARHLPLRIESRIPRAGHMVLSLEALTPTCGAGPRRGHVTD
ncbi:MAG TPA: DUF3108 domain-containing protein [Longimicrobium sp.]|nr:DUF3108 domain-containing protein [Longimicrobium sp.]